MALAAFTDARLSLGKQTIFEKLNLQIEGKDRIGLIGPNGSGKTSLLKVISQKYDLDHGNFSHNKEMTLGYLQQDIELEGGKSLLQFVRDSVPGRQALDSRLEEVEAALVDPSTGDDDLMSMSEELADIHERLAMFDSLYADHVALQILSGLGFSPTDKDRDLGEFSGGWKMRAVLAALLFMQPDLLLLDEPTNHLDMPSVAWFSSFLKRYSRAFVLISHDREFLNEQISRVISFEPEGVRSYPGDYENYLTQRAEEERVLQNRHANLLREREQTEAFISRFRAQANKAKAVQSRVKALEKMEKIELLGTHNEANFQFAPTERTSKEVIKATGLSKSYGELEVFKDVDLSVLRGEKIGVMGINGAGKTTLLKVLAEEIQRSTGEVQLGSHVKMGFYAQHHTEALDVDNTILEEVSYAAKGMLPAKVRSMLGSLLFRGDEVEKRIGVLSGGERARVALAKILLSPVNLLLMDEPTNHLDLKSSEKLGQALAEYDGTLIFVSHNRSFIRTLATRIWNVADGRVETYPGTLDEYMESSTRSLELDLGAEGSSSKPTKNRQSKEAERKKEPESGSRENRKERKRREAQTRKLRSQRLAPVEKEVTRLEKEIGELETLQSERSAQLADPDIYGDAQLSASLLSDFQSDAAKLTRLNDAWEKAEIEREDAQAELDKMLAELED